MKRDIGPKGLALIKSFEGFVPYLYDDLVVIRGRYPEWKGGLLRGTLTLGIGHTAAARCKVDMSPGARVTEAQALDILRVDLSECVEQLNAAIKVNVTQGVFDALVSFTYNCGFGNGRKIVAILNRGDPDAACRALGAYTRSKGQVLAGLVRRRRAEQSLWNDTRAPAADEPVLTPKSVEKAPRPLDKADAGAVVAGGLGTTEVIRQVSDTVSSVKLAHDDLLDTLASLAASPSVWIALAVVAGVAVLWWRYHNK